ncbi:hypothetical protein GGX14DRAFT_403612 [Mycena pura]|uniref:Uncharacterized protein n=1 Tax=Mycena pura TaxID=153505 RepID=A0AAD6Y696_9AGAR|nr:hypothetical protein GGX14DRAFT_403612 [Mycena pura]
MIALRVQCVHSNTSEICDSMYMNIRNIPSQNGGKGGVILRAGQNLECGSDDHDSAWHSVPDVPKLVLRDRCSCNVGSRRDVVKRAAGATRMAETSGHHTSEADISPIMSFDGSCLNHSTSLSDMISAVFRLGRRTAGKWAGGRRPATSGRREAEGGRGRATRGGGGRGQEILMSACSDCSGQRTTGTGGQRAAGSLERVGIGSSPFRQNAALRIKRGTC